MVIVSAGIGLLEDTMQKPVTVLKVPEYPGLQFAVGCPIVIAPNRVFIPPAAADPFDLFFKIQRSAPETGSALN